MGFVTMHTLREVAGWIALAAAWVLLLVAAALFHIFFGGAK